LIQTDIYGLTFIEQLLTNGFVYRGGTATDSNLTPRLSRDISGPKRGLSTYLDSKNAFGNANKAQKIDISRLGSNLDAVLNDYDGHVSIRPSNDPNNTKLTEWASQRGTANENTNSVKDSVVDEVKNICP
jgi:hypothetical protein